MSSWEAPSGDDVRAIVSAFAISLMDMPFSAIDLVKKATFATCLERILYNLLFCLYLGSFSLVYVTVRSAVIHLKPNLYNLTFTKD